MKQWNNFIQKFIGLLLTLSLNSLTYLSVKIFSEVLKRDFEI